MGQRGSAHASNEATGLMNTASDLDQFLRGFDRDLRKMTTKHRQFGKGVKRRLGGTMIINYERPPSEDLLLYDIARSAKIQQEPYKPNAVRRIFALKHGHDGAMLLTMFNEKTCEFDPLIHCVQITIPVDIYEIPQWLREVRGTRHQSADYLSKMTNAVIITVSEERGAITVYHRGQSVIDVGREDFMKQLRGLLLEAMQKERTTYATVKGTTTLAEDQVRSLCQLLVATPQFLEYNSDWFRSFLAESRRQFYPPATYRRYQGAIETPVDAEIWRAFSSELGNAARALARFGVFVELDDESRGIKMLVAKNALIQFVSTKALKTFLDHVTWFWLKPIDDLQWYDRTFEHAFDDFISHIFWHEDKEDGIEPSQMCAFGEALQALLCQTFYYEDPCWQVARQIVIRWAPNWDTVANTAYADRKFLKDADMIISMLKKRKDRSCYILQYGSMRLGGFILSEKNEAIQVVTAFVRRDLLRSDYFYRLLATYFKSRNWSQRYLFYYTSSDSNHELYEYSESVSTEPRPHFSTVNDYVKKYHR